MASVFTFRTVQFEWVMRGTPGELTNLSKTESPQGVGEYYVAASWFPGHSDWSTEGGPPPLAFVDSSGNLRFESGNVRLAPIADAVAFLVSALLMTETEG